MKEKQVSKISDFTQSGCLRAQGKFVQITFLHAAGLCHTFKWEVNRTVKRQNPVLFLVLQNFFLQMFLTDLIASYLWTCLVHVSGLLVGSKQKINIKKPSLVVFFFANPQIYPYTIYTNSLSPFTNKSHAKLVVQCLIWIEINVPIFLLSISALARNIKVKLSWKFDIWNILIFLILAKIIPYYNILQNAHSGVFCCSCCCYSVIF